MCLIGLRINDDGALLIAANRDEFAARPTRPMHWWGKDDADDILAGKDLAAGGTWLGMTRSGRFAAVTNVRDPRLRDAPIPFASRGLLVTAFLNGSIQAPEFIEAIQARVPHPSPFNLLLGDMKPAGATLYWYGARTRQSAALEGGVHVLSNAELNTPWPKAQKLRQALAAGSAQEVEHALTSTEQSDDALLPDTGVGYAWEKKLSAALITGDDYHTRSSTLIAIRDGKVDAREVTWTPDGKRHFEVQETFAIEAQ